jgi:hypothetical protein
VADASEKHRGVIVLKKVQAGTAEFPFFLYPSAKKDNMPQCSILCMQEGGPSMDKCTNEKENEKKSDETEKAAKKTRKRKSKKENANDKLKKWLEKL